MEANTDSESEASEEGSDDGFLDLGCQVNVNGTFNERLNNHISMLRDFCDGLAYQQQFQDHRMLEALERDGALFFRLVTSCLSRERRQNSRRGPMPATWEESTSRAMFYRTRPNQADQGT